MTMVIHCDTLLVGGSVMAQWKPVLGYEGLYEVSDDGRVRRVAPSLGTKPGRLLTPQRQQFGYLYVPLARNPRSHNGFRVGRLVAAAFHGAPPTPKHQVNHKNGIKDDDRAANLEWVTPRENTRHRFDVLGKGNPRGSENANAILSERQVAIMKALRMRGASNGAVAEQFGITIGHAKSILNGHIWQHIEPAVRVPTRFKVYSKERPRGAKNSQAKLTAVKVREIRLSKKSGVELAARYGVSATTITNVRKCRVWKVL